MDFDQISILGLFWGATRESFSGLLRSIFRTRLLQEPITTVTRTATVAPASGCAWGVAALRLLDTPTPYGGVPHLSRYCVPARGHQRIEDRGDGSEEL